LIDQDAFLSEQRIAVLECSWLSGTVSILASLGARTSQDRAHPTYSVNPAPPGSADVSPAYAGVRTPWERGRPARMQPCRGRFFGKPRHSCSRFRHQDAPHAPFFPCGRRLTGAGFSGSPCVPSSVSGIRTPKLPLLPLWEKGAGGMRGKRARECRKPRIAPRNATLEGRHRRMGTNTGEPRIVFCPI
jgi:hypothetical protein